MANPEVALKTDTTSESERWTGGVKDHHPSSLPPLPSPLPPFFSVAGPQGQSHSPPIPKRSRRSNCGPMYGVRLIIIELASAGLAPHKKNRWGYGHPRGKRRGLYTAQQNRNPWVSQGLLAPSSRTKPGHGVGHVFSRNSHCRPMSACQLQGQPMLRSRPR